MTNEIRFPEQKSYLKTVVMWSQNQCKNTEWNIHKSYRAITDQFASIYVQQIILKKISD